MVGTSDPKRGCFVRLDVTAKERSRNSVTKMCKELQVVKMNSWYPLTKQYHTLEDHKCFLVSAIKIYNFDFTKFYSCSVITGQNVHSCLQQFSFL
jgi:hypothetical protein